MTDAAGACPDSGHFRLHGARGPTRQNAMSSSGEVSTADVRNQRSAEGTIEPRPRPPAVAAPETAEKPKRKPKPIMLVILGVLVVGAVLYWLHARNFEDTDDAQIDGNISNIGPRVNGTVTAVRVVENQVVKANDVLLEIDPTDLSVAVAQAKAAVAQAE